jgi:hypothetical protein
MNIGEPERSYTIEPLDDPIPHERSPEPAAVPEEASAEQEEVPAEP